LDERLLVKECLQGKQESQKQLYEHFASKMLGVCYRYASSHEEAEDFLQEAFITVFRKLNQFKGEGELGGWIYKIVVNTSLNCIKARHRFTEVINIIPIDFISEANHTTQPDSDNELMELIHQLPRGYKTVFNLYVIEDIHMMK
jgi:RNA polymerase sigma factor (sigma-70 family)